MINKVLASLKYLRHEGVCHSLARFFKAVSGIFYKKKIMFFYGLYLSQPVSPNGRLAIRNTVLQVKEVTADDISQIIGAMYQPADELSRRFKEGQRCFTAFWADEIAGYIWTTANDEYIPDIDDMFDTPDNGVYLYNVRTRKKFRRKGVFTLLLCNVCQIMHRESFAAAYSAVLSDNAASIRGFEKCGFIKYRQIIFRKRLFKKQYEDLSFDLIGYS